MLTIKPPHNIEIKLNWLREMYQYSQLMGELIFCCDTTFGYCEFAKGIENQDQEKSCYQFWAIIQQVYTREYDRVQMEKVWHEAKAHYRLLNYDPTLSIKTWRLEIKSTQEIIEKYYPKR